SEAHQHGDEAASRQADAAQGLVHDKGDAGHVAGIFQDGQEEEQGNDGGQKAQHAANACENAVNDEGMYHGVDAVGGEPRVHQGGEVVDAQGHQVGQRRADDSEGQPEHQRQNDDEAGNGSEAPGQDFVQLHTAAMLPALGGADDG